MVEDIITALSLFLRLTARNSSFTYKGHPGIDIRQVGRELGVLYVLEGSVRRAGERVRIAGQLIDGYTSSEAQAVRVSRGGCAAAAAAAAGSVSTAVWTVTALLANAMPVSAKVRTMRFKASR